MKSQGLKLIVDERIRQITEFGYDIIHDSAYVEGEALVDLALHMLDEDNPAPFPDSIHSLTTGKSREECIIVAAACLLAHLDAKYAIDHDCTEIEYFPMECPECNCPIQESHLLNCSHHVTNQGISSGLQ